MIKRQGIEFHDGELQQMVVDNLYIVKCRTIYQPVYSKNTGESLRKIYYYGTAGQPLPARGRFYKMDKDTINNLLGFELLIA